MKIKSILALLIIAWVICSVFGWMVFAGYYAGFFMAIFTKGFWEPELDPTK